jgi:hypothetical protein
MFGPRVLCLPVGVDIIIIVTGTRLVLMLSVFWGMRPHVSCVDNNVSEEHTVLPPSSVQGSVSNVAKVQHNVITQKEIVRIFRRDNLRLIALVTFYELQNLMSFFVLNCKWTRWKFTNGRNDSMGKGWAFWADT